MKTFLFSPVARLRVGGGSLLLVLTLMACTASRMAVPEELSSRTVALEVKGRQGWQVNQNLQFGPFETGKIHRGWIKGYDYPFFIRFSGAKEKLSFDIRDGHGNSAHVACLGKLRETDLDIMRRYFSVNLKTTDTFGGTIVVSGRKEAYDFMVANLNQAPAFGDTEGFLHMEGEVIKILPIKNLESGQKSLSPLPIGFTFTRNGRSVGAVETLNAGRIWLSPELEEGSRLVLAGLSSALLLRSDLNQDI